MFSEEVFYDRLLIMTCIPLPDEANKSAPLLSAGRRIRDVLPLGRYRRTQARIAAVGRSVRAAVARGHETPRLQMVARIRTPQAQAGHDLSRLCDGQRYFLRHRKRITNKMLEGSRAHKLRD